MSKVTEDQARLLAADMQGTYHMPSPNIGHKLLALAVSAKAFDTESDNGWQVTLTSYIIAELEEE